MLSRRSRHCDNKPFRCERMGRKHVPEIPSREIYVSELGGTWETKLCWSCGDLFQCGTRSGNGGCWCEDLPHSTVIRLDADCLCPKCLPATIADLQHADESTKTSLASSTEKSLGELIEGEDYYRDNDRVVFTARYHLRRGYCCHSGCRHCPF